MATPVQVQKTSTGAYIVVTYDDGATKSIPVDPANSDYAALVASGVKIADYVAPPPPVPQMVALWQAQAALQQQGLLDKANAAVAGLNDQVVTAFWTRATDINRSSPTLARLAAVLGLNSEQVDALFVAAAQIAL